MIVEARTSLERLLLRDRWLVGSTLLILTALCWAWIAPMAIDMYGTMQGSSAWMMTRPWDATHLLLLLGMWTVMMVGMMLPSATPALFLYLSVVRKSPDCDRARGCAYLFAGGYLWVWTLFSVAATVLQLLLNRWLLLSPMMEPRVGWLGGAILIVGGIYQLTPFKRTCLQSCRSPVLFLTRHWKPGLLGGFRMGMAQGWYCLGCCWALMLLLFAGGVMNLWWIGALTVFVLLEKLLPIGAQAGRISGVMIILMGLWSWFRQAGYHF